MLVFDEDGSATNAINANSAGANKPSTPCKWSDSETRMLLDLYSKYHSSVGPLKEFRKKKSMWEAIACKISNQFGKCYNAVQVETRYKCVNKRAKKAIENNSTSGAAYSEAPFGDELQKIAAEDDSVCPEVMMSAGRIIQKADILGASCSQQTTIHSSPSSSSLPSSSPSPLPQEFLESSPAQFPKRRKLSQQEEMFCRFQEMKEQKYKTREELLKEAEQHKERRHKEKMEILKKILEAQEK